MTNSIDKILTTALKKLERENFQKLNWPSIFTGDQEDLQKLVHGFLDEEGELRKKGGEYIFALDQEKSFSIAGEHGFDRFTSEVCFGNEDKAFWMSNTVLTSEQLKEIGWNRVHNFKALKLFKEIETLLENLGKESSEKIEARREVGDLRREKGRIIETLVNNDMLKNFFEQRRLTLSVDEFIRNKERKFLSSYLSSEQQKNPNYKNDKRSVVREIDVFMPSAPPFKLGILVEMKYDLHLKHIEKLLSTLEVMHLLFPKYKASQFRGAFAFYEANYETIEAASKAGLYLLKINQAEIIQENLPEFQPAAFNIQRLPFFPSEENQEQLELKLF